MTGMNRLDQDARSKILHLLCEGQSIRAITRLTGASKNTVIKLLVDAGRACAAYQDRVLRNLPCKRVQVDEIWSFIYTKHGNLLRTKNAPHEASQLVAVLDTYLNHKYKHTSDCALFNSPAAAIRRCDCGNV